MSGGLGGGPAGVLAAGGKDAFTVVGCPLYSKIELDFRCLAMRPRL